MQEWMRWEPVKARRFSSLLATPARVVVAAGASIAMAAGLLPWAEGVLLRRTLPLITTEKHGFTYRSIHAFLAHYDQTIGTHAGQAGQGAEP